MKRVTLIPLISILVLLAVAVNFAQDRKASPSPTPQECEKDDGNDRVYTAKEVDVKAKVKNRLDNPPQPGSDCPRGSARVVLRAVLHKSGKVTGVKLIKRMFCSYDQQAIEAVRKFKFTPAIKDGHPVSQYADIEYEYHISN